MSQSNAVRVARTASRPTPRPTGRGASTRLRVVGAPVSARSRAGLTVGCLALLAVGLVGLLLLNVSLERGAFIRKQQQAQIEQLQDQRQALVEELAALEAPRALARAAIALGMVEAPNAAFVRTSDGRILGVPSPGVASTSPKVTASGAPASGRGTSAGPAASLTSVKEAAAGTVKASTKVTATGRVVATTTAAPGTPTGQRTGVGKAATKSAATATATP